MKKGTLTFERPFQTKSPDSLRRCQRINQNRMPIPVQVAKGYTLAKKHHFPSEARLLSGLFRALHVGLVPLNADAFLVH